MSFAQILLILRWTVFAIGSSLLALAGFVWIEYPLSILQSFFRIVSNQFTKLISLLPALPKLHLPKRSITEPESVLPMDDDMEYVPICWYQLPIINMIFPSSLIGWVSHGILWALIIGFFYLSLDRLFQGYHGWEIFYVWQDLYLYFIRLTVQGSIV